MNIRTVVKTGKPVSSRSITSLLLKPMDRPEKKGVVLLHTYVAGFRYYEGEEVWFRLKEGDTLRLIREPKNPYDYDAVQIFWGRDKIGYIPRAETSMVAQLLDKGVTLSSRIISLSNENPSEKRVGIVVEMAV